MGRPKTPIERMSARSPDGKTPGKRELDVRVDVRPDRSVPKPPAKLEGRALDEWERIWTAGWWLVRDQDYFWVEMIAKAYHNIEVWEDQIEADGLVVKGYAGQDAAHPLIAEIRKAQQTIQKCLQVLGFSPTDRAKLAIQQNQARTALEEMIKASRK